MTPRTSVRAATRAIYSNMRGRELVFGLAPEAGKGVPRKVDGVAAERAAMVKESEATPTPDPSPLLAGARGGGERAEQGARGKQASGGGEKREPDLMTRVRALYEDSTVPVAEIARLVGVTERTLYKYAAKGEWRRRYVVKPRGEAAAAANRGRHWQRADGFVPVKGTGGRFTARAEAGRAVAHGLKALDPDGAARAALACAAAELRHCKAASKARAAQVWEARRRAIDAVSSAMAVYNRFRATRSPGRSPAERAHDEVMEGLFISQIEAAVACVKDLKLAKSRKD